MGHLDTKILYAARAVVTPQALISRLAFLARPRRRARPKRVVPRQLDRRRGRAQLVPGTVTSDLSEHCAGQLGRRRWREQLRRQVVHLDSLGHVAVGRPRVLLRSAAPRATVLACLRISATACSCASHAGFLQPLPLLGPLLGPEPEEICAHGTHRGEAYHAAYDGACYGAGGDAGGRGVAR